MVNGTVTFLNHQSRVLRSNPLHDPADRKLPVYLPPGYDESNRPYPLIWVLAPFSSWGERFFNLQAWDENLPQRMDRLIDQDLVEPAILVFPNCFTRLGGSQYINSSAVGRYEDYLTKELVPFVDANLRTIPNREYRGLIGHSSGGYGAWVLAMRHPDLFGGFASHSGDASFEHCYWPDIGGFVRTISTSKGRVEHFLDHFASMRDKGRDWGSAVNLIAMSACYSPNPKAQLGFDLLCDPRTGKIDESVWQRWKKADPVRMVPKYLKVLHDSLCIYFDCGIRDEYNLYLGARQLDQILNEASITHTYLEHDGGHLQLNWRYDHSMPILTKALSRGL